MLTWFPSCSKCSVKSCQRRGEWVLGSLWFLFNISKAQLYCSLSTQSDCGELGAQEHSAVQRQRCEWCLKNGVEHELCSSSRTPPAVCTSLGLKHNPGPQVCPWEAVQWGAWVRGQTFKGGRRTVLSSFFLWLPGHEFAACHRCLCHWGLSTSPEAYQNCRCLWLLQIKHFLHASWLTQVFAAVIEGNEPPIHLFVTASSDIFCLFPREKLGMKTDEGMTLNHNTVGKWEAPLHGSQQGSSALSSITVPFTVSFQDARCG